MEASTQKCSRCHNILDIETHFRIRANKWTKTCNDCCDKRKLTYNYIGKPHPLVKTKKVPKRCEHNKRKHLCEFCGGTSLCIHKKYKARCRECKGTLICEHNKHRYCCKDCKGNGICSHNKRKAICIDCKGASICEHNKFKAICKQCGGSQICSHNRVKTQCVDCKGGNICEHSRQKATCKECRGTQVCEHLKNKQVCKDCNYEAYLVHKQRNRIRVIVKKYDTQKTQSTIKYIGCSTEDLVKHILSQMTPEMTLDNIHIDHIKPVSKFNLQDPHEFAQCTHWSNLRPLLATKNLEKSNKWTPEDEENWQKNIIKI